MTAAGSTPATAGQPAPRAGRWVGAPLRRLEDPRLLTGRGTYLDDIRLPGLLHAVFVRSPHAHARVGAVDVAAARALPGVVAVLGGRDLDLPPLVARLEAPGFRPTPWPVLAPERARFAGEAVAVVCAASPYLAADAAERVVVAWEPLPPVPHVDAALEAGAPRLHQALADNVLFERQQAAGDVDGAFRQAALVLRETFAHGRVSASPLEPRGLVAHWDGERLTVWAGTQVPFILRAVLARTLGLAEGRVRVIVPDTGGGFGQKMHVLPEEVAVAALARRLGRPVKWVETRRENLAAAAQAREQRLTLELAADRQGRVLALRAHSVSDAGAYHVVPLTAALEPLGTAGLLPGPYRIPACAWSVRAVATTKPPLGAYRGVGMTFAVFALERMLDLLARELGLDPAEVRRRNLIPPEAYPWTSATGLRYDSGDLPAALARALALAEYDRRRAEQAAARQAGRLLGIGLACFTESTAVGGPVYRRRGMADVPGPEAATVMVAADGSVACRVSFPCQGQGHPTTVAQVVAEELGLAPEQVTVLAPDTAAAPPGSGTFASRGAVIQQGTAARAATALREKLLALAASRLEAAPADLELTDGQVRVRGMPSRAVSLVELARLAHYPPAEGLPDGLPLGLEATERFDPPMPSFSSAVHVATVEVDRETGRVRVDDYVVVEDCGRVINPLIVEGQIHGAVAQGLGEALREQLVYDAAGQLLTGTLMEYGLPAAMDLPSFRVGHLETPSPVTPGGAKGMGEGGTVGAPAAVANAVADALAPLGVRVTTLPLVPSQLVPGTDRR